MLLVMISAQLTAASPGLVFDLATLPHAPPTCNAAVPAGGEIVVCGKRSAVHDTPIKAMPVEETLPKAEFKLFGKVRGKVSGEQGHVGPIPTSRAMVTMSVPF